MRRIAAALLLIPLLTPVQASAEPAATAMTAMTAAPLKLLARDFPDPDVIQHGTSWYAYATNGGSGHVPVASAPNLDGPWRSRGDAMPGGPSTAWARTGFTWAPDVHRNPDGTFTLTYTARHRASGRQCIGVATATGPLGPFQPAGGAPLICPVELGGAIDANTFVDTDGTRYLLWKNDGNAIGQPSTLWLSRTTANGTQLVGSPVALLTASGVIEAPDLVKRGSRYVLFFSGGNYGGCGYLTSYAVASALTGPWTQASSPLMTTASIDHTACGPGGADIVGGRIVFHGWVGSGRHIYSAPLLWENELPVVRLSMTRYEAELGGLSNCVIRTQANASGGRVVGYIDFADSWVEHQITAPTAGLYALMVTYANGSGVQASHRVTVNGTYRGDITYQNTGWNNWTRAVLDIHLNAGANLIRLGKGQAYAELDYWALR